MKRKGKRKSKGEVEDERKRKRNGKRRGGKEKGKWKRKKKGKWERKGKRKERERKKQVQRPELPRTHRHTHVRQSAWPPRAPERGGPGCAICSPGLVPERLPPQPRVLPERRRMDGRPPRTGSRCAPVCRVRGRPASAQRARLRRGVCGRRARSARPALPRGLPLSPPGAPAAPWRPPRGEPALAHPASPEMRDPLKP